MDTMVRKGRPKTSTAEKRQDDTRARQAKFRRKQRLIAAISKRLLASNRLDREAWLEFLAYAVGAGENLYVGVEWERGGTTRYFSDLVDELIGDAINPEGAIVGISL